MKITYFHQYFVSNDMPGGTRSYEFAKRLVKMGHEVNIITSWRETGNKKNFFQTIDAGIKIYWIPVPYSNNMNYFRRVWSFLSFAFLSVSKAKSLKADIVFASSTPLTIALPSIYISKIKKIPLVFEVRDLWPSVPIAMKILKNSFLIYLATLLEVWTYRNSKSIIALSPAIKKGIISKNINPKKIAVIPNCCDLKEFQYNKKLSDKFRKNRSWLNDKPLLVYAGTFGKVNNLSYVVNLAKSLKKIKSEVRILLIGEGLDRENLIKKAKIEGVFEKNLFFENQVPKKQIVECYSAANMTANFVLDVEEAWANSANKFFDGLAAGKPVLLNHGGWMQDLVNSYNCGLCVHGKTFEAAAKELDLVMSDSDWLKSAGKSAKKLGKKFFDRDILAQKFEKVLNVSKKDKSDLVEKIADGIYN